jgi:Ca2+-binding RTX toxin-like protein
MGFTKQKGITATFVLGAVLAGVACGDADSPQQPQNYDEFGVSGSQLGVAVPTCSGGTGGWTSSNKTLALALVDGTSNVVVVNAPGGILKVNGYTCVSTGGTVLTTTNVTKITVAGSVGNDKVILDTLAGGFGSIVATAGGGISLTGGGGTDALMLRGTASADTFTMGSPASGTDVYAEITGDKTADIYATGFASATVSLGSSNDTFSGNPPSAAASAISGARFTASVTTIQPVAAAFPLTVYGGDGNDTIQGGNGNDFLYGGPGDDTFKTAAAADGADSYFGDANAASAPLGDTIDYSARTTALTVTIGPAPVAPATYGAADANDGDATANAGAGEADDIEYSVENITGGSAADTLTGSTASNFIKGGAGNDVIQGGAGNASCASDKDTLEGDDGNDTFDMTAATDCGDVVTGGNGNDTVDYGQRTNALTITLDVNANDGESGEQDNIKDAEVVFGGAGNDTISGGTGDDELHGGAGNDTLNGLAGNDLLVGDDGNDTLNGGAGDDTFDEGLADTYPAASAAVSPALAALSKGLGDDIINGGAGTNRADYSERTADLVITLCADNNLTGAPAGSGAECTDNDGDALLSEHDKVVNCNTVFGGGGADTLSGTSTDDSLYGGLGDNVLDGKAGDDLCLNDAVPTVAPVNCEIQ